MIIASLSSLLAPAAAWAVGRKMCADLPALLAGGTRALVSGGWLWTDAGERITALPFLLTAATLIILARLADPPQLAALSAFLSAIALLAAIDHRHGLLPDFLVIPLLAGGVAAACLGGAPVTLPVSVAGTAAGWVCARLAQRWLKRRGGAEFGDGDVKLLAAIGAWLGPIGGYFALTTAFAAFCVALAARRGREAPTHTGFGPYLLAGTCLSTLITTGSP